MLTADKTQRVVSRDPARLWDDIQCEWARDDRQRWKVLACIHLRLHCQWNLDMIGRAFGHPKGHILRLINRGLVQLRSKYAEVPADSEDECQSEEDPVGRPRLTPQEIDRRLGYLEEEVEIWRRLRERIPMEPPAPRAVNAASYRVITDSIRAKLTAILKSQGPCHPSDLAHQLGIKNRKVRKVLMSCPEFYCDVEGLWNSQPFVGQEAMGGDVESIATASKAEGNAQ